MFEWLFLLLTPRVQADASLPPREYYVGLVAAEAAYTTLQAGVPVPPAPTPAPPVDPKNCPTCKNSGRPGWVRTGDNQNWTRCPTCQPVESVPPLTSPPKPTTGWPPRPRNDCSSGNCPVPNSPEPKSAGAIIHAPVPLPRRFPRRR